MTRSEQIHILRQQVTRSEEMMAVHRRTLATVCHLRAHGGYTSPEAAERAVNEGATCVVQMREAAAVARAELAVLQSSATT